MLMRRSIAPKRWDGIACRWVRGRRGNKPLISHGYGLSAIACRTKNAQKKGEAGYIYSYTTVRVLDHFFVCCPCGGGVTMVTRRLSSRVRRNARRAKAQSVDHVYGVPVPEGLHEAIETERDHLSKAESVLGCLAIAMEY